jgi:hypothetical protein
MAVSGVAAPPAERTRVTGVAVGLDHQGQGAQGLRNSPAVVAYAGLVVDEYRPWICAGGYYARSREWIARH